VHSSLERALTQTKNLALWMTYIGLLSALIKLPKDSKDFKEEVPEPE
jgi:hypothetical protein